MTDKWIGPRVLCGASNPPPDGYEYVRRYAEDVRLAAGSGTTVENENVAGYVAFRRDWMRRHGLHAERCSLVDVTGDSMEPECRPLSTTPDVTLSKGRSSPCAPWKVRW